MARQERLNDSWGWTANQRKGLIILLLGIVVALGLLAWMNPLYLPDKPGDAPEADRIKDRLDPNTASAEDLSILPMLGGQRAREIVAFRQRELQRHPGTIVFEKVEDLGRVHGIGVATARSVEEYLIFPATQPATFQNQ